MLNNVTLMGRIVRDPELRMTQNQTPVASFSIACERDTKDKETDFVDCTAWRHTAEFIHNYMTKGQLIVVTGRLQIRQWTDNNGNKRTAPEINVSSAYFAENKRKGDADERPPMPTDADAPPEIDNTPPRDIDDLTQDFPNLIMFADLIANDGDDGLPF